MSKNNKNTEKLLKLAASNELVSLGLVLQSTLRITQSLSKDPKAQNLYIDSVLKNLNNNNSESQQFSIPKIPQIPMFEDMYGNKMGDREFHAMVYRSLMGMSENETDWVTDILRNPPGE